MTGLPVVNLESAPNPLHDLFIFLGQTSGSPRIFLFPLLTVNLGRSLPMRGNWKVKEERPLFSERMLKADEDEATS